MAGHHADFTCTKRCDGVETLSRQLRVFFEEARPTLNRQCVWIPRLPQCVETHKECGAQTLLMMDSVIGLIYMNSEAQAPTVRIKPGRAVCYRSNFLVA